MEIILDEIKSDLLILINVIFFKFGIDRLFTKKSDQSV